ncbi:pentalenene oxygenase [Abditibacteriota bacterium]|nr:pentalenene oxygenase [Abditibacteriota bacterium]
MTPPLVPLSPAMLLAAWGRQDMPFLLRRSARRHGDLVQLRRDIWLASHPELVQQVLVTNPTKWSKARGTDKTKSLLGEGILGSGGELHRSRRRVLQPLFAASRLSLYADTIVECALETRSRWQHGQLVDMSAEMSALALRIVARSVFGVGIEGKEAQISGALDVAMRLFNGSMTPIGDYFERFPPIQRRFMRARTELDEVVYGLIESKRREGAHGQDVVSVLLRVRDEEGQSLSDEAIRDEAMTLLLAGHETTANALAFAWWFLARYGQVRQKLEAEANSVLGNGIATFEDTHTLTWTRAVLSETMRLLPPAWIVGRLATQDISLESGNNEIVVPQGTTILVSSFVVHRDGRFWPEPRRFDPARWANDFTPTKWSYFPFGGGHRACLAEGFAWMEATLALATLAQKFRAQEVGPLRLEPSVTLRPRGPLWMRLEKRD